MKFKSVIISGFRAYDDPKDANFDFSTSEGDASNFISLYAPNGFGKSSFYDAVEWAVTNQVSRLWKKKDLTNNFIRNQQKLEETPLVNILKHKDNLDRETYVRYLTDQETKPIIKKLKVHGASRSDIKNEEQGNFQSVILSQEWISAFLKEDDGRDRYKKFMKNSDLQDLDVYYQNVKVLSEENDAYIDRLHKEIEKLKSHLIKEKEENLLEKINSQIEAINKQVDPPIKPVLMTTSRKEIIQMQNRISEAIIDYDTIDKSRQTLNSLKIALTGDDKIISKEDFFKIQDDLIKLGQELKKIEELLEKFEQFKSVKNESHQLEKELISLREDKTGIDDILKNFPSYREVEEKLEEKRTKIILYKSRIKMYLETLEKQKRSSIELDSEINRLSKSLAATSKQLQEIPGTEKRLNEIASTISNLESTHEKEQLQLKNLQAKLEKLNDRIQECRLLIGETKRGQYSLLSVQDNTKLTNAIKTIELNDERRRNIKSEIKDLDTLIAEQNSLNKQLENFIKDGLDLANQRETNTCPLCEHTYENYEALATRISNNKALSGSIQRLLKQRNDLQQQTATIDKTKEKAQENLITFYENELKAPTDERKVLLENIRVLEKNLAKINREFLQLQDERSGIQKLFTEDSIKDFELRLRKDLVDTKENLEEEKRKLNLILDEIQNNEKLNEAAEARIKLLEKEIVDLQLIPSYSKVIHWFKEHHPERKILMEYLQTELAVVNNNLKDKLSLQARLEKIINTLNTELKIYSRENLQQKKKEISEKETHKDRQIDIFRFFLLNILDIDTSDLNKEKLEKELTNIEKRTHENIASIESLLRELHKLKAYSEIIFPFLESENARHKIANLRKEIQFVESKVSPKIIDEVKATKEELDTRISKFFYEDLINEIYSKIDPHPDFTKVGFKANFDGNLPSLEVYVMDEEETKKQIPNLYFSAAQMNILSLSIFLATALKSEEYDCIFIDDPIQSMDTINILSTIDLLRGIILKLDKQIILSTHDRKFHELLKKKIPVDLFGSKFLELESFGKLKKENVTEFL